MPLNKFLTRLIWLCVLPLVLLAAYLAFVHVNHVQKELNVDAKYLAQSLALAVDHDLKARIDALNILAVSPLADQASQHKALYQEALGFHQAFGSHVILADLQKHMLFNTREPFGTPLPMLPQPTGQNAALTAMQTGKPAVGDIFFGPTSKEPLVGIAVPGQRKGKTAFLVITPVEARQFQQRLEQLTLPADWSLALLDSAGKTLARRGPPGAKTVLASDTPGQFIVHSQASPWSVVLEIPRHIYFAPLLEAATQLALAILGATLAGVLGGKLAGRQLAKSVTLLGSTANPKAPRPYITEIAAVRQLLDQSLEERNQAEAAQRDSEQRFRATFKQAAVGISLVAPAGRLLQVNQKLCDITGFTQAELLGKTFQDITHPDDLQADLIMAEQLLEGAIETYSMEKRYLRQDGSIIWVASRARQRTEALLQRSQLTLNQAARITQLGAWSIELLDLENFNSNPVTWSTEMYRLMDYRPEDIPVLTPDVFFARVHPDDRQRVMDTAMQALADKATWQTEFRLIWADGSERLVVETGEFSFDESGTPQSMMGAVKDITEQRRIDIKLRDSEMSLKMALEGAGAGSYELNLETGLNIWSDELWALFGLAVNSAPACLATWRQTVHPDDLEQVRRIIRDALVQQKEFEIEWQVKLPPGEAPRWLMARSRPVKEKDGRVVRYRGLGIDITKRKQAELSLDLYRDHLEELVAERTAELSDAEAEQRRLINTLRLLSDCSIALVRAKDENQLLDELCQLVVESGGYLMGWVGMAEQNAEKSVRAVAQSGFEEGYLECIQVSWDGEQAIGCGPTGTAIRSGFAQVNQNCLSNPQMAPWRKATLQRGYQSSVALPLIIDQQVLGALTLYSAEPDSFGMNEVQLLEELANDMAFGLQSLRARSQLVRYQQQLEKLVQERTQKIAELNAELTEKVRDAEAANLAKGAFLATMSHELRTPLNAVVGLTGLLADSPLGRRQRDYADKILLSAQALRALIDDILDFSRIEAGELRLEQTPFSLNALLRTTAAVVGVSLRDKPIEALFEVAPDIPDMLIGDALRLQQILLNLTSNAVKFTDTGVIVVSVRCLAREATQVTLQFAVRDTGIGISSEQLGAIFEGFVQADTSTSRLYGGSGLGLAISARLASLMGGQIEVDSAVGSGSEFHFSVSLALGVSLPTTALGDIPASLSILIIDDHPLARDVLTQTCAAFGWQATALDSGAAGLLELRRSGAEGRDYDLMLLDWRMPGMDGLEMLRQAYDSPDIGLPLVVLMASMFGLEQAVAASDDLYLDGIAAKPMTPAGLLEAVTRAYSGELTSLLPPPDKKDRRLAGMRLLVAEDNELNQEVVEQMLTRSGAEVVIAANGLAAVTALQVPGARFDAVLMDIQMPVMDGYSATRIIREELGRLDLPIIAVTAFARPEDREKSRLAGMVGHLVKPLNVEDLLDLVAKERQGALDSAPVRPDSALPVMAPAIHLPGLDVAAALNAFGGDQKRYREILHKFIVHHGGDAEEARRLFNAADLKGAAGLVHGLSGVASILQATELARLAAKTETALVDGHAGRMPALFDELQAAMLTLGASIHLLTTLWADAAG